MNDIIEKTFFKGKINQYDYKLYSAYILCYEFKNWFFIFEHYNRVVFFPGTKGNITLFY